MIPDILVTTFVVISNGWYSLKWEYACKITPSGLKADLGLVACAISINMVVMVLNHGHHILQFGNWIAVVFWSACGYEIWKNQRKPPKKKWRKAASKLGKRLAARIKAFVPKGTAPLPA